MEGGGKKSGGLKICFWNVAGLMHLCEETWEYLDQFDVIGLTETWIEEESWKKLKNKMSNKFQWVCIPARRENKKGRAKGGIIVVANKNLKEIEFKEMSYRAAEVKTEHDRNRWRIITLYSQDTKEIMNTIMDQIQEEEEEYLVIGGHFNP